MTINQNNILKSPSQGDSYWVLGDLYTFKAIGEDTGKAYALFEIVVRPRNGTPPHIHSHEDEAFYMQEGELEFQLDERILIAIPGTFLHSPKGQASSLYEYWHNTCETNLLGNASGIREVFKLLRCTRRIPCPEDIEKILATAPKYGLEIIPPPSDETQ